MCSLGLYGHIHAGVWQLHHGGHHNQGGSPSIVRVCAHITIYHITPRGVIWEIEVDHAELEVMVIGYNVVACMLSYTPVKCQP